MTKPRPARRSISNPTADRRRGKSDPIDARLAALAALRTPAGRLAIPRAGGDWEAVRILLSARREFTITRTGQVNRLRALLLTGDDADRSLARGRPTSVRLHAIARRRGQRGATTSRPCAVSRHNGWLPPSTSPPPSWRPTASSW